MPYVLPAMLDAVPRSLRGPGMTAAERAANSSAAPLPGVPRRSRTPANNPANVRIGLTLFPPTPPEHDAPGPTSAPAPGCPSSSSAMIALSSPQTALLHVSSSTPLPRIALGPRSRRIRARESCETLSSVAFPSAAPDVLADKANYVLAPADAPKHVPVTPGKNGTLRLSMDAIRAGMRRSSSTDMPKMEDKATPTPSSAASSGLRKKSGELVKPSLKHAHTLSGGFPTQAKLSRSAPATPTTPKFVHFDAQLEHVRLFLAEQKPTAVSRDGSPVDTSEGEGTEFPWGGRGNADYHSSDDERARKMVRIKNTTLPAHASIEGADVRLHSLVLAEDGTSLVGRVLVRNLAFEKWVAVRFTFDWWQTTSEVSARYVDTVAPGVDCFGFSIKLGDVLHRIEEKTLFVAVRYTVAGREIWDSNNNQNYMVAFTKEEEKKPASSNQWAWSTKSQPRNQMNDLRKSLERVIQDEDDERMPQLQIKSRPRANVRGMSFGGFESKPTVASIVAPAQPAPKFGARYDFGAATRERPSADGFRMPTLGADSFSKREAPKETKRPVVSTEVKPAFDPKMCASPRDLEDGMRLQMAPVEPLVPSPGGFDLAPVSGPQVGRRHHHRAAYFDAWSFPAPGVKRTCSGGPNVEDLATDQSSIPASWMGMDVGDLGGSIASTPSITSSSSPSQSPSSPPEYLPSPEIDDGLKALDLGRPEVDPSNYNSFLDRFCFFTGPANERRTHSRSSSDSVLYGFGTDATAQTLRAVSSSLSSSSGLSIGSGSGSDVAVTPRAGTPVGLETPLPAVVTPALH
ncbi:Serine/threonine-protein phosphatase [Ceratobasidium sp. AG-Ba]|nr:Serine/threonine-protein phosphatase [Ceratobasidium sp. AG-Ba]